jgi:hypothetical protein
VSDSYHQPEVFHEALAAFANKLGVECPEVEVTPADLDAVILAIHAAALLAVLDDSSADTAERAPRSGPMHSPDCFARKRSAGSKARPLAVSASTLR